MAEVQSTKHIENMEFIKVDYTWNIKPSQIQSFQTKECGYYIDSPQFHAANINCTWNLRFFPNGTQQNCTKGLYLCLVSSPENNNLLANYVFTLSTVHENRSFGYRAYGPTLYYTGKHEFVVNVVDCCLASSDIIQKHFSNYVHVQRAVSVRIEITGVVYKLKLGTKLAVDLGSLFENKNFSDFKFIVGNDTLHAHRCILAARSRVFAGMFESNMQEAITGEADIRNFSTEIFVLLLKYIYTDTLKKLTTNECIDLLSAANRYGVLDLKLKCAHLLSLDFTVDNVFDILILADMHSVQELKHNAMKYICQNLINFSNDIQYENILESNPTLLMELLTYMSKNGLQGSKNN